MAGSFTVDITDRATPVLNRIGAASGTQVATAAGRAVANLVKSHLVDYNASHPNQDGFPRTNFFVKAARSTQFQAGPSGALVSINQVGFRQRLEGGLIKPTGGRKFLTIAAIAEAYGKRAGEFDNLEFGFAVNKEGRLAPALVEAAATKVKRSKRKKDKGKFIPAGGADETQGPGRAKAVFWLIRQANQKGDAGLLPSGSEIEGAATRAIDILFARIIARQSANGGAN